MIAAMRVKGARQKVSKGCVKRRCSSCGLDVWLAQSAVRLLNARPGLTVTCLQCTEFLEEATEITPLSALTAAQTVWKIKDKP